MTEFQKWFDRWDEKIGLTRLYVRCLKHLKVGHDRIERIFPAEASSQYARAKESFSNALIHANAGSEKRVESELKDFKEAMERLKELHQTAPAFHQQSWTYSHGFVSKERMQDWLDHCKELFEGLEKASDLAKRIGDTQRETFSIPFRDYTDPRVARQLERNNDVLRILRGQVKRLNQRLERRTKP